MSDGMVDALVSDNLSWLFVDDVLLESRSAWVGHIPFAHWLIAAAKPKVVVELGTHTGVSLSAFNAAVLAERLDTSVYAVDTWEGDKHASYNDGEVIYADLKAYTDARYEFCKMLRMTFAQALDTFKDRSIDILHIDGLHTYEAVREDFVSWLPKMSESGVVLFHDTRVFEKEFGVWKLWRELRERYWGFEFEHSFGLGVLVVGEQENSWVKELRSLSADLNKRFTQRFATLGSVFTDQKGHLITEEVLRNENADYRSVDKNRRKSFILRLRFLILGR